MLETRYFSRINTLELKSKIESKFGRPKAEKYFELLTKFLTLKISKSEFNRLCIGTIGKENVCLHNHLLRSIIRNACLAKTPPLKESKIEGSLSVKVPNGYQSSSLQSLCRDFLRSSCKARTPNLGDRKSKDRHSPLRSQGKGHTVAFEGPISKTREQQSATELLSLGSRPPGSVEDGEEVDQAAGSPGIHSRSLVRAPLGIPTSNKGAHKVLFNRMASYHMETCHSNGELLDTISLRKRLGKKLEMEGIEGISVSVDCANLINNSLDVYLKRLIKPCLTIASSRSGKIHQGQGYGSSMAGLNGMFPVRYVQKLSGFVSTSMLDFQVAMELNPSILGEEWPIQLEKVRFRTSQNQLEH